MKRLLALILTAQIFLLSLGGIKASLYFAINKSFIIRELCQFREDPENTCQGQCHLNSTIKKQVEEDSSRTLVFEGQLAPFFIPLDTDLLYDGNRLYKVTEFLPWLSTYSSLLSGPAHRPPPAYT
ncbi:MAG TPA: hypothetical protein DIW47_13990 [Bacteroidetes bacterium]|nr:hypothetical protein [Bacteroidota bacterium]